MLNIIEKLDFYSMQNGWITIDPLDKVDAFTSPSAIQVNSCEICIIGGVEQNKVWHFDVKSN